MMAKNNKPNPDDRTDNVAKLKSIIQNTLDNIETAEEIIPFSSPEEKARIDEKNERRKKSIYRLKEEIEDERRM